ncbi:DUF6376 family protein [Oceanobacillus sp. 1P07AA]|uniref:DUF6376 family protein n=1 Tax=Oceanobacillus sp. 1P07AA TaxID=3132293 RepID=UPI0039A6E463
MKKGIAFVMVLLIGLLGGCSILEGLNNSLNYANEATEYANEVNDFVAKAPSLAEQAITDEQSADELETELNNLKENINEFNNLDVPEIGEGIHQQMVEVNNNALEGIDLYLSNLANGALLDPSIIENTEIFQTLEQVTELVNQIQELG